MERHQPRDLDGVIDGVARAMTSRELARDLRPVVAARLARPAPWTIGWGAGLAAAAVAGAVLLAVVMRPGSPPRPGTVAEGSAPRTVIAPQVAESGGRAVAASEAQTPLRRAPIPVVRQTIDDVEIVGIVAVSPLEIVPLDADGDGASSASHVVEIAPIDLEPVAIAELELIE